MTNPYLEKIAEISKGEKRGYGTAAVAGVFAAGNHANMNGKLNKLEQKVRASKFTNEVKGDLSRTFRDRKGVMRFYRNDARLERFRANSAYKIREYHRPAGKAMQLLAGAGTAYGLYSTVTK